MRLVFLLAAISWFGAADASAHGLAGPAHGQNALFSDGELVAVPTNFGLLSRSGDVWEWTPEELVRGVIATSNIVDDRPVLGTTEGLFWTQDGGCTWTGPPELIGSSVLAIEVSGDEVWVGTEAASRPSGLYYSTDGGLSFAPGDLYGPGIRVGGIKRGDGVVWATVFDANLVEAQLWADEGDGFQQVELSADRLRLFDVSGVEALVGVEEDNAWRLEQRSIAGVEHVWDIVAEPIDAAFTGDAGGPLFVTPTAELRTPAEVVDTETYCIGTGFLCRSVDGFEAAVSENGAPHARWLDVTPAECADETAAEQVESYWPIARAAGFGQEPPIADAPNDGCCRHTQRAHDNSPIWLMIFVMLMQGRRAAKMSANQGKEHP